MARGGRRHGALPRTRARATGRARCRAWATRKPGSCSSASPRLRTAGTGPGACSPATAPATSCSPPCTAPATPTSRSARSVDDGLDLSGAWVTAAVRCAPPDNKPTPAERATCAPFLSAELAVLTGSSGSPRPRRLRLRGACAGYRRAEWGWRAKRPRFAHGLEVAAHAAAPPAHARFLCSYHPSQRNVFTGLLTAEMFDDVLARARASSRREPSSGADDRDPPRGRLGALWPPAPAHAGELAQAARRHRGRRRRLIGPRSRPHRASSEIRSRPRSVRTMVSVQSENAPMPPVEMSACSAAKSGQRLHPSRVQACASFSGDLVECPVAGPDLEHALDVHLHDVLAAQPVTGLEQLGEDGVVEGLRAQQADRQARIALPPSRPCVPT